MKYVEASSDEIASINQYAEKTISIVKAGPNPDFGYDDASVKFLSDTLSKERTNYSQKAKDSLPDIYGSYLGASIIKKYGGKWVYVEDVGYAIFFDEKNFVFPMNRVFKHIGIGEEFSIYSLYVGIPEVLKEIESKK